MFKKFQGKKMKTSAYMKSLGAQFNPQNKTERKGKLGRVGSATTPTRKTQGLSLGKS
jgi:hypothetical protein